MMAEGKSKRVKENRAREDIEFEKHQNEYTFQPNYHKYAHRLRSKSP